MKYFTCIWEDRWYSGSHHHCLAKKTIIQAKDIHAVMLSPIGERCRYVFEGIVLSIGENFDESTVVVIADEN
jgi:flagellar biosynthesis/type III secretory pathway ATPase